MLSAPGPLVIAVTALGFALAHPGPAQARGASEGLPPVEALWAQIEEAHFARAETGARALLAQAQAMSGPDSLEVALVLDALVEARRLAGWGPDPETRRLAERSLAIRERFLPPDDPLLATSLSSLGRVLFSTGLYDEAGQALERALEIRRKHPGDDESSLAASLTELGNLEMARSHLERAEELLRESLEIRERLLGAEHPAVAKTLCLLAAVLHSGGQYSDARRLMERASSIAERARPWHPETAYVLSGLGNLLMATGEYDEAESAYERALRIRERALDPEHPDLAMSHNSLGVLARRMERFGEAQKHFELALPIVERRLGPRHPLTAQLLNNLAGVLWQMGAAAEALPYSRRALAIREETLPPNHPDLAQSYQSLAILLEELGDTTESEGFYRRALETYERAFGPEHPLLPPTLYRLAGLLRTSGRLEEALVLSQRALAIGEAGPERDQPNHAVSLATQGSLLCDLGRCEEAIPLVKRALSILERTYGPSHPEVGRTESQLATLFAITGRRREALELALQAEDVEREHLRLNARTLSERQALQTLLIRAPSLDLLLSLAGSAASDDSEFVAPAWDAVIRSRALVLDQMAARHRSMASAGDSAASQAARRYTEASKALGEQLVQEVGSLPPEEERAALDSLRAERDRAERALLAKSTELRREMERARVGLREVTAALPESSALIAYTRFEPPRIGPADPSGKNAGRASKDSHPRYAAFVLPSAAALPIVITLGNAESIDSLVADWRQEAGRDPGPDDGHAHEMACWRAGRALAERIWQPVAARLGFPARAFIVPEGALQLVSFAALPAGDSAFLAETGPVMHMLSSERDLVPMTPSLESDSRGDGGFLALGDPDFDADLPSPGREYEPGGPWRASGFSPYRGERTPCVEFARVRWRRLRETAAEVAEATALWKHRRQPASSAGDPVRSKAISLTGARATEAAFKVLAPGREVLHLATHGFFVGDACGAASEITRGIGGYLEVPAEDSETSSTGPGRPLKDPNPLRLSGLVLAGANRRAEAGPDREDGILTAEEIASLDLSRASWAILSACDTGVGEVRIGEGVLGLRRAFQVAGVRTVIMSLWPVGDADARAWMREFYRARFVENMDTAEAATRATRRIFRERRQRGESAHPFHWAAFAAAGDWR